MNRTLPILLALLGGLMALPAAAHAAVTCGFDATTHRLTITADANFDDPGVKRSGSLVLVTANEQPIDCAGPDATVTTTDAIDYTDTSTLQNAFRLDLSGGALAPGYTPEGMFGTAEIEIDVDAGGGYDLIVITGSPAADTYRAGTVAPSETRVNLNPGDLIPDADIVGSGVQVVTIYAGAGEDTIDARGGAGTGDPLVPKLVAYGGEDDDTVHAGAVESSMGGSEGDDTLLGGPGLDDILGGEGDDVVDGAGGTHDVVRFSTEHPGVTVGLKPGPQDTKEGMDTLSGFEVLSGTNGDDVLRGSSGTEELKGRGGRDVLSGFDGDDRIDGGDGTDTLAFLGVTGGVSVDLGAAAPQATGADGDDELVGIENVVGGPLADHITGDAGPNVLDGAGSGDVLDGAGGVDTLSYADRPYPVAVRLDGIKNDGADVNGDGISSEAEEGDHAKNIENATGGTEADRLRGSGVANVLVGGGGDDVLDGGLGADILDGGLGIDTLSYAARTTAVAVRLDGSKNDGADPDGDGFSSAAEEGDHAKGIENATGGSGPDRLISSSTVVNVLTGGAGADYLDAKDGSAKVDVLDCGSGADKRRADASDSKTSCETAVAR